MARPLARGDRTPEVFAPYFVPSFSFLRAAWNALKYQRPVSPVSSRDPRLAAFSSAVLLALHSQTTRAGQLARGFVSGGSLSFIEDLEPFVGEGIHILWPLYLATLDSACPTLTVIASAYRSSQT